MSATPLRSSCLCLSNGLTLWAVWAGVAPRTICWAWLTHGGSSGVILTPALFSLRTFPQLLFQGVSPVCNSCSQMIALPRAALILGSWSRFPMGLIWVGGWTPHPLPRSLILRDVVACSYHPLRWMTQCINVGWCFYRCSANVGMWCCLHWKWVDQGQFLI